MRLQDIERLEDIEAGWLEDIEILESINFSKKRQTINEVFPSPAVSFS